MTFASLPAAVAENVKLALIWQMVRMGAVESADLPRLLAGDPEPVFDAWLSVFPSIRVRNAQSGVVLKIRRMEPLL